MVELTLRWFLGGAIAVAGAAAIPKLITALPTVYGDGVHDDWDGITALWSGQPVRLLTDTTRVLPGGVVEMIGGSFRLSKTLVVRAGAGAARINLIGSVLSWTEPVDYCLFFEAGDHDMSGWNGASFENRIRVNG